ncbi:MAG: hypothetical protein JSS79_00850 [Bacteroidetes bacterium]|nr:hypothetical protein [Bacteroidota bacterium]
MGILDTFIFKAIKVKIAAHITFFFVEHRLKYLRQVIENLNSLPHDVTIFIYSNTDLSPFVSQKNIVNKIYPYKKKGVLGYNQGFWNRVGLTPLVHPYYLTWENRKIVTERIEEFDVQLYLEDDIAFTDQNLGYWLAHKDACLRNDYNPGFLRIEYAPDSRVLLTDILRWPDKIITLEGKPYLLNDDSSYCGFWIYDRQELKKFITTKEWKFEFDGLGIREKSAIGWNGGMMSRYKGTLLPLAKDANGELQLSSSCLVHHIPNTYINDPVHCRIQLPITVDIF